jgi:hypothetical protein
VLTVLKVLPSRALLLGVPLSSSSDTAASFEDILLDDTAMRALIFSCRVSILPTRYPVKIPTTLSTDAAIAVTTRVTERDRDVEASVVSLLLVFLLPRDGA